HCEGLETDAEEERDCAVLGFDTLNFVFEHGLEAHAVARLDRHGQSCEAESKAAPNCAAEVGLADGIFGSISASLGIFVALAGHAGVTQLQADFASATESNVRARKQERPHATFRRHQVEARVQRQLDVRGVKCHFCANGNIGIYTLADVEAHAATRQVNFGLNGDVVVQREVHERTQLQSGAFLLRDSHTLANDDVCNTEVGKVRHGHASEKSEAN